MFKIAIDAGHCLNTLQTEEEYADFLESIAEESEEDADV